MDEKDAEQQYINFDECTRHASSHTRPASSCIRTATSSARPAGTHGCKHTKSVIRLSKNLMADLLKSQDAT